MTDRAGRWVTEQVGRYARTVNEVASELGCDWHTVNDTVIAYGDALVDDTRLAYGTVARPRAGRGALRAGAGTYHTPALHHLDRRRRSRASCSTSSQVAAARPRRVARGEEPRNGETRSRWATLDLSGPYRAVFDDALPDATQVADPFHVVKLANTKLDECRRRVQNETLGTGAARRPPLPVPAAADQGQRAPRRSVATTKLLGLLRAGDPHGEVTHRLARQRSRPRALRPHRRRPGHGVASNSSSAT